MPQQNSRAKCVRPECGEIPSLSTLCLLHCRVTRLCPLVVFRGAYTAPFHLSTKLKVEESTNELHMQTTGLDVRLLHLVDKHGHVQLFQPGHRLRGWQRHAARACDQRALETHFATLPSASRALLLSQAGPHAACCAACGTPALCLPRYA